MFGCLSDVCNGKELAMMPLTLLDRARLFHTAFPKLPSITLVADNRWLSGVWILGNMWKHPGKAMLYGAYPTSYLKRIHAIFPDATNVLHLFSGVVAKGLWENETTLDINSELRPDIVGDVRLPSTWMKLGSEPRDLIVADPPYEHSDFERYNTLPFDKHACLKKCLSVTAPGGFLVWLDTRMPMYSKKEWLLVGTIGIIVTTNTRIRMASIFQKVEVAKLPHDEDMTLGWCL
jgi:hypothetical protein